MPKSPESPVFRFLTQKENLAAVLEVIRYTQEIREYVADRFWNRLEKAIKTNPNALSTSFSWWRRIPDRSDGCFNLWARPAGASEKGQALIYSIETHPDYFGMGLFWSEDAHHQTEKLYQLESVKALEAVLRRRLGEGFDADRWWLWWETWERNPYTDPWSWFGSDFSEEWFDDVAKKFWDFVIPTHALVVQANNSLSRTPR